MCEPPARTERHPLSASSEYLAYNVFSIDPNTICVEAAETALMDQLESYGLEAIPTEYFEVSPFGGNLHCSTVDIYREGKYEDYFPMQIEGF